VRKLHAWPTPSRRPDHSRNWGNSHTFWAVAADSEGALKRGSRNLTRFGPRAILVPTQGVAQKDYVCLTCLEKNS
jgi:hypothetical protein